MKKEVIISCLIVIIVVIFDIFTQRYTDFAMTEVSQILSSVRSSLNDGNEDDAQKGIEDAQKKWDEVKEKMVIYIEHTELEKVEMYIVETNSHIETKEYEMAVVSLDTCEFIIGHIKEKYKLSIKNIF